MRKMCKVQRLWHMLRDGSGWRLNSPNWRRSDFGPLCRGHLGLCHFCISCRFVDAPSLGTFQRSRPPLTIKSLLHLPVVLFPRAKLERNLFQSIRQRIHG
jgi:hypothetical protein